MKKVILFFVCVVIIVLVIFMNWFMTNKKSLQEVKKFNSNFLSYIENEKGKSIYISGIDLTTLMNKAIDNNEQNGVKKQENGAYILNKENSVEILVRVEKNGDYYLMEAFSVSGMTNFTLLYGQKEFKCEKIEYHENGKISKMIFGII